MAHDHDDWARQTNEDMRARLHGMEAGGIKCEIQHPPGFVLTWHQWFVFLGFRDDGYALNGR